MAIQFKNHDVVSIAPEVGENYVKVKVYQLDESRNLVSDFKCVVPDSVLEDKNYAMIGEDKYFNAGFMADSAEPAPATEE